MNEEMIEKVCEKLKAGGYTGLIAPAGECACEIDDLAPCGVREPDDYINGCSPGHKHSATVNKAIWLVSTKKEPPSDEEWESHINEFY